MEKQYLAPQLKLAGEASKVILGLATAGTDYLGQDMGGSEEFQGDEDLTPDAE